MTPAITLRHLPLAFPLERERDRDGNTFAHGHFDLEVAEKFRADLDTAIAEAKRRAAN